MTAFNRVAAHVDKGRGIAAKNLGQPFEAYRVEAGNSGDFPADWTVVTPSFPLFRRRYQSTQKIETGMTRGAMWFEIVANMNPYLLGDVFVQIDPAYQPGVSYGAGATLLPDTIQFEGIALAIHMPVGKSIGARLDRRVRIYRPSFGSATLGDGSQFFKTTLDNDLPLILSNGQYSFGQEGQVASFVPAGFTAYERPSGDDLFGPHVPGMPKPSRYFIYVPPLPGWSPTEGDALVAEDGSRYVVEVPFYQEAGVVGSQLVCHRQIRQNN